MIATAGRCGRSAVPAHFPCGRPEDPEQQLRRRQSPENDRGVSEDRQRESRRFGIRLAGQQTYQCGVVEITFGGFDNPLAIVAKPGWQKMGDVGCLKHTAPGFHGRLCHTQFARQIRSMKLLPGTYWISSSMTGRPANRPRKPFGSTKLKTDFIFVRPPTKHRALTNQERKRYSPRAQAGRNGASPAMAWRTCASIRALSAPSVPLRTSQFDA